MRDRRWLRLAAALLAASALVAACGDDDDDAATDDTADTEDTAVADEAVDDRPLEERADEAADFLLTELDYAGATAVYVAISDPENGDYSTVLGTVADGGDDATADDTFPIGSLTKTFTATVVLQMVEDDELALDDTVEDLLPDLAAEHPELAPLTVEQLLSMTSGVADYLNGPDGIVSDIVEEPMRVWEPEELIAAGVDVGVEPPGTPGYSTTNYIVLQLIAESVGGAPLEDLIATEVTDPLELSGMFLPPPEDTSLPEPSTRGYVAGDCVTELESDGATVEEGTETTDWNTSFTQGGGGMASTIGDLLGWAESMVGNTLLGDDLADQRLETSPIGGYDYGLGLLRIGSWYGHAGEAIGWEAVAVQDPETGVSVALASNGCGGEIAFYADFLDTLYPDGDAYAALEAGTSETGD